MVEERVGGKESREKKDSMEMTMLRANWRQSEALEKKVEVG